MLKLKLVALSLKYTWIICIDPDGIPLKVIYYLKVASGEIRLLDVLSQFTTYEDMMTDHIYITLDPNAY